MARLGLEREIVDRAIYDRTIQRFRDKGIVLPTLRQLADPSTIPADVRARLEGVDPDAADPKNLFRCHWYNDADRRGLTDLPGHLVIPPELTGVAAPIVLLLGERFPLIGAHKVLAAYGCLAPRVITGQFDPTRHKALWPSTGNYCRGGVAISRIMDCHGVAILPEGMSRERFEWLESWVAAPEDIIRTVGVESNVKEIYDKCAELEAADPHNIVFNQFCEFGNHLVHYLCTGQAISHVFETLAAARPGLRLAAYVSATGSAGTLAAGDYLKERFGSAICAVEAVECPTLLYNGFGEHNIQGIGDKHLPFIHNALNTDYLIGVSDHATDALNVLFNTDVGRRYLVERRAVPQALAAALPALGLSSICNLVAAIKVARYLDLGPDDAICTVATDSAALYPSELEKARTACFPGGFDPVSAGEVFGQYLAGIATDHLLELSHVDRDRVFNLGYFTWVEQQGVSVEEFQARRDQRFWRELRDLIDAWDAMIVEFNARAHGSAAAAS